MFTLLKKKIDSLRLIDDHNYDMSAKKRENNTSLGAAMVMIFILH